MDSYRVEVAADVHKELRHVSGHLRARILQVLYAPPCVSIMRETPPTPK
jgi:hypothetical protein